jgi:hypothetical protein
MSEEIQEIERLIKQSGELADSLIRFARKLQEQKQNDRRAQITDKQAERLVALDNRLIDVSETIDSVTDHVRTLRYEHLYAKARQSVATETATPQEAAIKFLQAAVADRTMTPDQAVQEVAKLLRPDLSASQKIKIRETAKAAFEAGDDAAGKIRPFLKGARQQQTEQQVARKTIAVTP